MYELASEMRKLNHRAESRGWRAAIRERFADQTKPREMEYRLEYIESEARADFRFLLPINQDSVVLDVGSGWGNMAVAFARNCRRVFALDTNHENLRFVQIRASQEGLSNVIPLQGDAGCLPLLPGSCDAVLMVGVLEWVAWGCSTGNPQQSQHTALCQAYRVLKNGGALYLGIENRFSFKYLLGIREPHTRMRFLTLLPWRLGDLYSRVVRGQGYRELTYSRRGLEALLHQVGFGEVHFFIPVPGYQNFRFLIDEDPRICRFVLSRLRAHPRFTGLLPIAASFAVQLRLHKWVTSCFSTVAVKR